MSLKKTDPEHPSSALPALPETVEAWLGQAAHPQGAQAPPTITLHRKTASRWTRVAAFAHRAEVDRHDLVLTAVSRHVIEHGATVWRLEAATAPGAPDLEPIEWISTVATEEADGTIVLASADPLELTRASWDITFKLARTMIDNLSVVPRLVGEVGEMYKGALEVLRDANVQSESVAIAAVQADASAQKLDKLLGVVDRLQGSPTRALDAVPPAKRDGPGIARKILRAATDDERNALLASPLGQALALADDWRDAKAAIESLWAAVSRKEITISQATLEAARAVLQEANG